MDEETRPDPKRETVTVFISRSKADDDGPAEPDHDLKAVTIPLDTALKLFPDLRESLTQPPPPPPAREDSEPGR